MAMVMRKKHGRGFRYVFSNGRAVKNEALKTWIKSLAIPPAWTEVEIDPDKSAKVHVTGRDDAGRKQYIYNADFSSENSEQKFERILRFGKNLERMRRVTGQHVLRRPLDETAVMAAMTRMLDEAYFRPGNPAYTEENGTYGLTTLRRKHMTIKNDVVEFDYEGKSHQQQHRVIQDEQVSDVLAELADMEGYEIFDISLPDNSRKKISAADLNAYIADVMGEDFSAKDFRTWAGTVLMAVALDELGPTDNEKSYKSNVVQAVKKVAGKLGNTPAICRANYIHPNVILHYETGKTLAYFKQQIGKVTTNGLTLDERATLKLLNHLIDKKLAKTA